MRKIKPMADKLKLDLNHDAPKEAQIAKLDKKEKDTASQLKGKSTKSRVSTMKSNGVISGRVKKSATRAVRKSAPPGIAAAIMEMTLPEEEEEPVEGIGESFVIVNDEHEDNAIVEEEEEHATKDKQQDGKDNGGSLVVNDKYEDSASGQPLKENEIHDRGGMEWTPSEVNDALEASMILMVQCDF
jgi:hypothetical protein